MNLCTPLAPPRYSAPALNARKVDITGPSIKPVLTALAASSTVPSEDVDLFVKVAPPVYVRVHPPLTSSGTTTAEMFEGVMSSFVGDPILSTCLMLVLALSVTLNGFLLKGIAAPLLPKAVFRWDFGETADPAPVELPTPPPPPPPSPSPSAQQSVIIASGRSLETPSSRFQRLISEAPQLPAVAAATPFAPEVISVDRRRLVTLTPSSYPAPERGVSSPSAEEQLSLSELMEKAASVGGPAMLSDEEVVRLAQHGKIAAYNLEKVLGDLERAVRVRRALICEFLLFRVLFDRLFIAVSSARLTNENVGNFGGAYEGL
jgi:hydroxymethylglutaryl-CoA reductase (NADPH)